MNRLLLYALAALLALSAALSFGLWRSVAANGAIRARADTAEKALSRALEAQKRTEAVLAQARQEKRSQARKSATQTEAVSRAAEASPEWAGTPTPPEVQKALLEVVEGLE